MMTLPERNPFSTRFVQPGALEFIFPSDMAADQLVDRLCQHHWWGQITGPHGSGKSSLLQALQPNLESADRRVFWVTLRAGQRKLPPEFMSQLTDLNSHDQVIVDGYEQLGWLMRLRLKRLCRSAGAGLLVTSHTDSGFPQIHAQQPDLAVAQQLVDRLMDGYPAVIGRDEVAQEFAQLNGDIRELMFKLYDLYEMRRHTKS